MYISCKKVLLCLMPQLSKYKICNVKLEQNSVFKTVILKFNVNLKFPMYNI